MCLLVALGVVVLDGRSGSGFGCEVQGPDSVFGFGGTGFLWPVSPLSDSEEANMEKPDHAGIDAVPGESVSNADLFGRELADDLVAELKEELPDIEPSRLATILEAVALSFAAAAEILRSG